MTRYVVGKDTDKLCEDPEFQFNPHSMVHIVIPVRNQGAWVLHLLENLEAIFLTTKDEGFRLILVDYKSSDIDMESVLENFKLPGYTLITLDPPFSRAGGVQAGIDAVTNPNDIILTCDLHLEIPPGLIMDVRRNTIQVREGGGLQYSRARKSVAKKEASKRSVVNGQRQLRSN